MKYFKLVSAVVLVCILSLLLGCGSQNTENSRNEDEKSGSWEQSGRMVEEIAIAAKSADTVKMDLSFGAAEFRLRPANMSSLAEGQIVYYDHRLVPEITDDSNYVKISQEISGIATLNNAKTQWNLNLSTRQVLDLSISAGAFDGEFDFSGLQLNSLSMATGAAEGKVIFNKKNPQKMRRFDFSTGASSFDLSGLLNSNFEYLDFKGGAGSYTLDFGGSLLHDDSVQADISVGVCDLTIIVPRDVSTRVVMKGALTSVSPGSFLVAGSREYVNGAYNSAKPTLEIIISMSVGSLDLKES